MDTQTDTNPAHRFEKYGFKPADLLKLDNFLAPTLILIFYWFAMVMAILWSLFQIGVGFVTLFDSFLAGLGLLVLGIFSLVLSPLFVRLVFEQMIVLFKIHDHLRQIRDTGGTPAE